MWITFCVFESLRRLFPYNIVFAKNNNICGKDIYSRLKEHGVLVRWFDKDRIRDFVRITIGTHDECKQLLSAIDKILKEVF